MGGPRRGNRPPQYQSHYHQHVNHSVYANYMPYGNAYYPPMPPQYQNGGMPSPGYMPYQSYSRSPPTMQTYVPMVVGGSIPQQYTRPPPAQSPVVSSPYQPPLPPLAPVSVHIPGPLPPQTPSSTHSSQVMPPHMTPPIPPMSEIVQQLPVQPQVEIAPFSPTRQPYRPPVSCFAHQRQPLLIYLHSYHGCRILICRSPPEQQNDDGEEFLRQTPKLSSFLSHST